MPAILDILRIRTTFPMFSRSLIRKYHQRYVKEIQEVRWLLTNHKLYVTYPNKMLFSLKNEIIPINPADEDWFKFSREVDDVQDWMIQLTDRRKMLEALEEQGWR